VITTCRYAWKAYRGNGIPRKNRNNDGKIAVWHPAVQARQVTVQQALRVAKGRWQEIPRGKGAPGSRVLAIKWRTAKTRQLRARA